MATQFYSPRDLRFHLYEVLQVERLNQLPYFRDHDRESFEMVLEAAGQISEILLKRETIEAEELEALLAGKAEGEIWGADDKALPPGTVGPEVPGTVTRPEAGPRPIPRPGYAAELRGLDLPEKPDLA